MQEEMHLVNDCLKGNSASQELLYKRFASKMLGVCIRYASSRMEAEDILQDGFIKVFNSLSNYRGDGSLEGWVRRIMVTTALNHYKANLRYAHSAEYDDVRNSETNQENAIDMLSAKDLLALIQQLPEGYRMVFNLYAIEGYSHKEIAEMLDISEGTSKSQLSRARATLQLKIKTTTAVYERTA